MTSQLLFQNTFTLRRSGVAIFGNIIKIVTIFIKTIVNNTQNLKELEIMYQNVIYIWIS